jgi:alpha-amylase
MPDACLYFQVHQPNRLLQRGAIRQVEDLHFEDDAVNAAILGRVADECYLPANRMFKRLIATHAGRFRMALSISGTAIEQMERHRPDVLESFRDLVAGGGVELLAETYYHSLAFMHSNKEFDRQVDLHLEKIEQVFHVRPRVFRNTELIYNDDIAAKIETMGFDGILAEGVERNLGSMSPNHLYRAPETARIKTLLRNIRVSDDLGFRISDKNWDEYPLTPRKFASWLVGTAGDVVNLFMGYETLGLDRAGGDEIRDFWENLPDAMEVAGLQWVTPSEAVDLYRASHEYHCRLLTSWTDHERDLSAWTENSLQREALYRVHALEKQILAGGDAQLIHVWANMQTSNHFHWMSTKGTVEGGDIAMPYRDAVDAHERFMAVVERLHAAVAAVRAA